MIFKFFINSNFNYCPLIWMFANKSDIDKLEKIQERALRFVHRDFVSDTNILFDKSNCVPIRLANLRNLVTEVFKCMNGIGPRYIKDLFDRKYPVYEFRDSDLLIQPKVKTTKYGIKSVRYYGSKLWNSLPKNIKSATDIQTFKYLLSKWPGPSCKCSVCLHLMP